MTRRAKAFTLAELILTMMLSAVLLLGASQLIISHLRFTTTLEASISLSQEAVVILEHISANVRNSKYVQILPNELDLYGASSTTIPIGTYTWSGSSLMYGAQLVSNKLANPPAFSDPLNTGNQKLKLVAVTVNVKDPRFSNFGPKTGTTTAYCRLPGRLNPVRLVLADIDGNVTPDHIKGYFEHIEDAINSALFVNGDTVQVSSNEGVLYEEHITVAGKSFSLEGRFDFTTWTQHKNDSSYETRFGGSSPGQYALDVSSFSNFTIEYFTLESAGLNISGSNVQVNNNHFSSGESYSNLIIAGVNVTVDNNIFDRDQAVAVAGTILRVSVLPVSCNAAISNNKLDGVGGIHVAFGGPNVKVFGNEISNITCDLAAQGTGSSDATAIECEAGQVYNNIIRNCNNINAAITVGFQGWACSVSNNYIHDNTFSGYESDYPNTRMAAIIKIPYPSSYTYTIVQNTLKNNIVYANGTATSLGGGGISYTNGLGTVSAAGSVLIQFNYLTGNSITVDSGIGGGSIVCCSNTNGGLTPPAVSISNNIIDTDTCAGLAPTAPILVNYTGTWVPSFTPFSNNTVSNCHCFQAMHILFNSTKNILNNLVFNNDHFGIVFGGTGTTTFSNNLVYGNGAVGIEGSSTTATLKNNTIANNGTCGIEKGDNLTIMNSIIYGNTGDQIIWSVTPPVINYTDIQGATKYTGTGSNNNNNVDPLFVDASNGNFLLQSASLCVDGGNPSPPTTYNDGARPPAKSTARNDMGAYGGPGCAKVGASGTLSTTGYIGCS